MASLAEVGIDDPELLQSFQQLRHNHEQLLKEKKAVEKLCVAAPPPPQPP